jgi:hypothetical protein
MGLCKKDLQYYEDKHNNKFSNDSIKVTKRIDKYIYFQTEFGECKMHIGNVGKATYSMQSAINKTVYLVNRLIKLHGNKFDYSLVDFTGKTNKKVKLICNKHGIFEKVINTLITKKNVYCTNCYNESIRRTNRISSTKEFIQKATILHNSKYDYSDTVYVNARIKVNILCKTHGTFSQTPMGHLSNFGCTKCKNEKTTAHMKNNPTGWTYSNWERAGLKSKSFDSFKVYIIECFNKNEKFYKIGKTFKFINVRFSGKSVMPYNYKIVSLIIGNAREISELEWKLKINNKKHKYIPKIEFGGMYECFNKLENYEGTI